MAPLLLDAINQTIANPTASHQWRALSLRYANPDSGAVPHLVEELLLTHIPRTGVEGFLLTTFLTQITGNLDYISEAGKIVQKIVPFAMDRLAAFSAFEWWRTILNAKNHVDFIKALSLASIPELMRMQGDSLATLSSMPPRPSTPFPLRKVALVASSLYDGNHPPTIIALQQARLLKNLGFDVHIYSSQELHIEHMPDYLGNQGFVHAPSANVAELGKLAPKGVSISFPDEKFSLQFRSQQILGIIDEFDPDLVFFVGLHSPLLTPLYNARPVLGLCVHSTPPMAPVDLWLSASPSLAGQVSQVWGKSIPETVAFYHPYRIGLKPVNSSLSRDDLGISAESCVLISVGGRLDKEISGEWAEQIAEIVRCHPSVTWLLVGGKGVIPSALARLPAENVCVLPHHIDLKSVYRCCDIYINPPRLGGGFSVAEAMAESLPVVSFSNSDGGIKLGDFAVGTKQEYTDKLKALLASPNLRQNDGAAMRTLFSNTLDLDQAGPSLLAACEASLARYQQRVENRVIQPRIS